MSDIPKRRVPRCPVAEFAAFEQQQIAKAKAEYLRQCQAAEAAGLPHPKMNEVMPDWVLRSLTNDDKGGLLKLTDTINQAGRRRANHDPKSNR